ncbi:EpsD family peptidyl-prolyl cis-trans isomerase [Thiobacillus sp. 65-1402]|uniref:EpsD family peptidyl-prolyl cis-trans isomerase n=1 Tax=Thiobacillus sp. 65-1402 TaxID=1895861 RepID=UPI00086E3BDE|nr:EpsD family peptidyl-prolyl cis-trans isomerase [Thiobacillus sp. 65-1402]ODU02194.1 MAG: peptidyl-prolyl cis-trans isomerase, EpsD family [Thiobacillus sp. SCN 63-1177]OJW92518.1 MAG: peptidyl-prolyl cis-trans isomerase, EpsD family [Thiobacillus sp. 65-1402]
MQNYKKLVLPLLIAALIAGCGDKKEEATGEKAATQVAAKVNGTELTVHQVNYALQRIPNLDKEQSKAASLQVVRNLVDQEVIAQKALTDKLDRDPTVVQALDAARRQILAEAYMGRKLGTPAEPSDAEVTDYFNRHPELFAQRKIYRLQEISIKAPADRHDAIRAQLGASKNLSDFAAWLKAENLPAKAAQGVKPAEQLPLQMLPQLAKMPDGQAMVVNAPDGLMVVVLADSQVQPVTLEQAKPAITRLLQAEARQKAAKAELDALKAAAKIEYVGEFADAGKEATAPAEKPAAPAAAAAPAATPAADADAISKGVSGLK